jgi:hypothetical protein
MNTAQLRGPFSALLGCQRTECTRARKLEKFAKFFLSPPTVSATAEVGDRNFLSSGFIIYSMYCELIEIVISITLCVVVTSMIDLACYREATSNL